MHVVVFWRPDAMPLLSGNKLKKFRKQWNFVEINSRSS
jgi:hypothetical protein